MRGPGTAWLFVSIVLGACGARSGLEVEDLRDGGVDAPPCVPRVPAIEVCNGADDDCDGTSDEGLPIGPLGEARALRTTEGDTGAEALCVSCRWAWSPSIAAVEGGMLVPFFVGIYGGREMPSLFFRRTDRDGVPVGEVGNQGVAVPLMLRRMDEPGPDGATWIDATLRVGFDDRPGWVIVERDGSLRTLEAGMRSQVRSPSIVLGGALVAGWAHETNVRVDVLTPDGIGVRTTSHAVRVPGIELGGLTSLALARTPRGDEGALFVARFTSEPRAFRLFAQRLDRTGTPNGEIVTLLEDDASLSMLAIGTEGGYLLFDPGNGSGPTSRFVDEALTRVEPPVLLLETEEGSDYSFDFLPLAGGGFLVHTVDALVRLDARGAPQAMWRGRMAPGDDEQNRYVVRPDLAEIDGRLFVTWHGIEADRTPNTVWIRELACADPD